jgi:glycyl-tRNA synthetase
MVKDAKTNAAFRADKLLEQFIETKVAKEAKKLSKEQIAELEAIKLKAEVYKKEELAEIFTKLDIKSPETGNLLTAPEPFNLMFGTQIGPSGQLTGYLRPETAQGIYVNFLKLNEFNNGRIPFAAA